MPCWVLALGGLWKNYWKGGNTVVGSVGVARMKCCHGNSDAEKWRYVDLYSVIACDGGELFLGEAAGVYGRVWRTPKFGQG